MGFINKLDKTYTDLLQDILDNGTPKSDRTGTGTISVFGRQIRHKMSEGFPLLTTKKMPWKSIVTELLWFLQGNTNIKWLVDNGCNIWNGDAYKNYLKHFDEIDPIEKMSSGSIMIGASKPYIPFTQEEFISKIKTDKEFSDKFGNLGPIYGKQWRAWRNPSFPKISKEFSDICDGRTHIEVDCPIDQIQNLINDLNTNPDSRRLMVNAWNVADVESGSMVLPPCHYGFQVYTRELSLTERRNLVTLEKYESVYNGGDSRNTLSHSEIDQWGYPTRAISLMYNARSQDVPLGTPFNISSYALLLVIIGKMVNMVPDELITNMGDCHIYLNQIDGVREQITREPFELPELVMSNQINFNESVDEFLNSCLITDFIVENYQSHPTIKMPLSN